jgi:hypothetical protein
MELLTVFASKHKTYDTTPSTCKIITYAYFSPVLCWCNFAVYIIIVEEKIVENWYLISAWHWLWTSMCSEIWHHTIRQIHTKLWGKQLSLWYHRVRLIYIPSFGGSSCLYDTTELDRHIQRFGGSSCLYDTTELDWNIYEALGEAAASMTPQS